MRASIATRANILQRLKNERDQQSPDVYPPVPEEPQRTLLLLGPSRAGKSTIVQVLRDSLYQTPKPELYSATREPQAGVIGGLRIIDMPGFYDRQAQFGRPTLTNRLVLSMLRRQIKQNGLIDLFGFVFHLANGINSEDIEAMLLVKQNLPPSVRMLLIVTHAEETDIASRKILIDGFFQHPRVIENNLRQCFDEQILFLGSLRYESLQRNDYDALSMEHQNVLAMRKDFLGKCFADIEQRPITLPAKSTLKPYFGVFALMCCVMVMIGALYHLVSRETSDVGLGILEENENSHVHSDLNESIAYPDASARRDHLPKQADHPLQIENPVNDSIPQDSQADFQHRKQMDTMLDLINFNREEFHDKEVILKKREVILNHTMPSQIPGSVIHFLVEHLTVVTTWTSNSTSNN